VADSSPGRISIPAPGGADTQTQVFEAGLPARTIAGIAEPAGSNPAEPTTTQTGTITFTSPEDDGRDPNKESHLEPRTDAPTYAFGNKGKNAERGQGTVRKIIKYYL
jgi:hypothetical protein